jgi:predicted DNA-binding protein YlxM (UPF0122 family)
MGKYQRGWSAKHQEVFKLRMLDGLPTREIAEKTGLSTSKVNDIMRTKAFLTHEEDTVSNAVEKARKLLENKLLKAVDKIVHIMEFGKPEERLRYDAAKEILYQCGMKPVEVIETRGRQYTPEEIKSSLEVMKEIQNIEEKLSTQGSGFLIKRDAEPSSPISLITNPCPTDTQGAEEVVDTKVEEVAIV